MKKEYRAIFLNAWAGTKFDDLMNFIEREREGTDIFCLQEIMDTTSDRVESRGARANLYKEIINRLEGFEGSLAPEFENRDLEGKVDFPLVFGNATFWRREIPLEETKTGYVHRQGVDDVSEEKGFYDVARNVLLTRFEINNRSITIGNFHGLWTPVGKGDNPDRIKQADRLVEVIRSTKGEFILGGDFNLDISNPSLKTIGQGMRNLIIENGVTTTRSSFYTGSRLYADYVLVSGGVAMTKFRVLKDSVSDHLPMELIFS